MANLVNYCPHFLKVQQIGRSLNPILTEGVWKLFADIRYVTIKENYTTQNSQNKMTKISGLETIIFELKMMVKSGQDFLF